MSWCDVHWCSNVLGKQVGSYLLLPDQGKPPFAVFYLLHGLSDDHTIWLRRTAIERYVAGLPLIVVMPDGFRGFYTDHANGPPYGQYLAEELPAFIERNFPAKKTRTGRSIGGLSMGGYGALRIALAHPDRYISAHSHSGAFWPYEWLNPTPTEKREKELIFGSSSHGANHDLIALAKRAKRKGPLPALRIDCGTEDFLLEQNRRLHRELDQLHVPHQYEEFPGKHNWEYWDEHIQEALRFHAEHLKLKR